MSGIRSVVGAALVAGALATACGASKSPTATLEAVDNPAANVIVSPSPTTTLTPAPTTAAPTTAVPSTLAPTTSIKLPQPERVPSNPYFPEPEVVVGTITIPRLKLDVPLRQGVTLTTLDKGPGYWPGTALPGQIGNVVVAGHRVTHTRPFRHIDTLGPGDEVIFTLNDGTEHRYVFDSNEVVPDTAMRITAQTVEKTATLFACHPPGSAQYRFVVYLRLVEQSA